MSVCTDVFLRLLLTEVTGFPLHRKKEEITRSSTTETTAVNAAVNTRCDGFTFFVARFHP